MIAFGEGFRYFENVHPAEATAREVQVQEAMTVTAFKEQRRKWGVVLNRLKIGTTELVYAQREEAQGTMGVHGSEPHIAGRPTPQDWLQSWDGTETFIARHALNADEWREQVIQLFETSAAKHGWGRQREREKRRQKIKYDRELGK